MESVSNKLTDNVKLLKTKASKYSFWGVFIAICSIFIATLLSTYFQLGQISLQGLIQTQKTNPVLWVINLMPFVFAFWGQYVSAMISYQAGAMVIDQTEELRSQASTLEYRLEDTMRENTERERLLAELDLARRDAERANKFRGQFLANMSHEIRTPMNGIINMTGLLLETDLEERQREYADIIKNSSDALLSIINDILDFSKIDAGKMTLEEIGFDLHVTLENTFDTLDIRAREKGLEFVSFVEPNVPSSLEGDPGRLRQVLTNLTGNAIKFTSKGGVSIKVSMINETEHACMLRFDIHDTGIGIPADRQKTLFEDFVQAEESTTRNYGGTGLGLSISRQLAKLMGGEIGVESEEGKCSTFWFTAGFRKLQKYEDISQVKLTEPGNQSAESEQLSSHHNISESHLRETPILLVEDNEVNQMVVIAILKKYGFLPDVANNGAEALTMLEKKFYQLVLMDCQMPVMDGYDTTEKIRQLNTKQSKVPIIAMTAHAIEGDRDKCIEAGMDDYISKPVSPDKLAELVNKWVAVSLERV